MIVKFKDFVQAIQRFCNSTKPSKAGLLFYLAGKKKSKRNIQDSGQQKRKKTIFHESDQSKTGGQYAKIHEKENIRRIQKETE